MFKDIHLSNKPLLLCAAGAVMLGLGIAYWQNNDITTGEPTTIRSIDTPTDTQQITRPTIQQPQPQPNIPTGTTVARIALGASQLS